MHYLDERRVCLSWPQKVSQFERSSVKSVFPEWYDEDSGRPKADAAVFVRNTDATVAFDANALLQVYRLDLTERSEIIAALKAVEDRLFVPYQAAIEYQRRRKYSIANQYKLFDDAQKSFQTWRDAAAKSFASPAIDKRMRAASEDTFAALGKLMAELRAEYALTADEDDVRDALDELLTVDRLGSKPTHAQLFDRTADYERRAVLKIPPGYMDADKGAPGMYGDHLIWCELLDRALATQKPLLLVTNETKEDWSNKDSTPRLELVQEMEEVAGVAYHHVDLRRFLRLAKQYLSVDIADETIDNVQEEPQFSVDEIADILAASDIVNVWNNAYRDTLNPITDSWTAALRDVPNPLTEQLAEIQRNMRNPIADYFAAVPNPIADAQRRGTEIENTGPDPASDESSSGNGDDENTGTDKEVGE